MTMFQVVKPTYRPLPDRSGFRIEWSPLVAIEAPTAAEAISIARGAGHVNPILDDYRTPEQRSRDIQNDLEQQFAIHAAYSRVSALGVRPGS